MSRPLFFTGRRDIARSDVEIQLRERPEARWEFAARLRLSRYRLPEHAEVVVEAYHETYLERFPFGTVGHIESSHARELSDLPPEVRPRFRVKVVERMDGTYGRLLAALDEISPLVQGDRSGASTSLLPVVWKTRAELGQVFWRLYVAEGSEKLPELWVNKDVPGLYQTLRSNDPAIIGFIIPEALRQALGELVLQEDWTDEGMLGRWLSFAKQFHSEPFDPWDQDDPEGSRRSRLEWVNQVVDGFARQHKFLDRYSAGVSEDSEDE